MLTVIPYKQLFCDGLEQWPGVTVKYFANNSLGEAFGACLDRTILKGLLFSLASLSSTMCDIMGRTG